VAGAAGEEAARPRREARRRGPTWWRRGNGEEDEGRKGENKTFKKKFPKKHNFFLKSFRPAQTSTSRACAYTATDQGGVLAPCDSEIE
jgi:hypothetical protein